MLMKDFDNAKINKNIKRNEENKSRKKDWYSISLLNVCRTQETGRIGEKQGNMKGDNINIP